MPSATRLNILSPFFSSEFNEWPLYSGLKWWASNFTGQQDLQVEKVAGPTQKLPAVGLRTCGNPEHWQ